MFPSAFKTDMAEIQRSHILHWLFFFFSSHHTPSREVLELTANENQIGINGHHFTFDKVFDTREGQRGVSVARRSVCRLLCSR